MRAKRLGLIMLPLCLIAFATPASAQDATSAKTFLESSYRQYGKGGKGVALSGPQARRVFDESLLALIRADEKANGPDQVGVLDGDPICSCQDWDALRDLQIAVETPVAGRAVARVSFALFAGKNGTPEDRRRLEITLASRQGQWRVWDVLDTSEPGHPFALRAELSKDIQTLRKAQGAAKKP
jgi:Protein of unknown function (DUF3828)